MGLISVRLLSLFLLLLPSVSPSPNPKSCAEEERGGVLMHGGAANR